MEERKETRSLGLDLPRTDGESENGADELTPSDVDIFGKHTGQIVRKWNAVSSHVGSDVSKSEEKASEELGGTIIPERDNVERVPKDLSVDDLRGSGHNRPEKLRQGHGYWDGNSL